MDEKGDIRNIYEHIDCLCGLTFAVEIKKKQTVRKLPFISSSFLTRVIPLHKHTGDIHNTAASCSVWRQTHWKKIKGKDKNGSIKCAFCLYSE